MWYDSPICKRATKVIPGLLRKLNVLEGKIERLEAENRMLEEKNEKLAAKVRRCKAKSRNWCVLFGCCLVMFFAVWLSNSTSNAKANKNLLELETGNAGYCGRSDGLTG